MGTHKTRDPNTNECRTYVVFRLQDQRYGLRLSNVKRIERAVCITPLPDKPIFVLGVINIHGTVTPVFDVRQRFGLRARQVLESDHFVICWTGTRIVALLVDEVEGIIEFDQKSVVESDEVLLGLKHVGGLIKTGDGIIIVQDLARFLSMDDERKLDLALKKSFD